MSYHPDADHAQQFSQTPKKTDYDVVIIGGATSGSTISFFLSANPDFKGSILVVEKDPSLSESATRASNYCMRQQFATEINIKIAQYAAHFVKNFRSIVQDEAGLTPDLYIRNFGYLYLADDDEFAQTLRDDQKVQAAQGAGTRIVSKEEIAKLYPFFGLDNVLLGSLNTRDEGEFDGWTIFQNLRRVATARGVDYIQNEVVDIAVTNNNVDSVTLKTGERIKVGKVVNAAGTRSGKVSAMAGIHLPLEARQRYTYIFEGEHKLDRDVPLTIDPSGIHVRQFGDKFLAGAPPEGPEVGVAVNDFDARGDVWATKMKSVMERLLPALGRLTVTDTWIGHYDFNTFDHNAIIGPHHVIKNFLFCCGFSGHGSQQGPACGRAVSELITYNEFKTLDLTCLRELYDLRSRIVQLESQGGARHERLHIQPEGRQEQFTPFPIHDTAAENNDDPTNDPEPAQSGALPDSQASIRGSSGDNSAIQDAEDVEQNGFTNPLVPERPVFIQESSGKLSYLGHSSAYAFTQQVLQVLQQASPSNPSPEFFPSSDGSAYKAELHAVLPLASPDVSGLPSKGIALHYLQCVKFRTEPLFYLFDELDFNSHLNAFYEDAVAHGSANPVWYTHYLVLMAFGRALDAHEHLKEPWPLQTAQYFQRALSRIPDMAYLANEPLEATEMYCCIALYLQCVDHRRAAISYIGLALRMAHLYALHLDLQESIVGSRDVERGRRIWWTVYALNQKLTSGMGTPNFLNDSEIKTPTPSPSPDDEDGTALLLHVKICQLLGLSIKRVYRSTENDRKSFVTATQTILKEAVGIAKDIKQYSESLFGEISRVAAHLELAYHQCIILTCRPVLFCLLKMRFETSRNPPAAPPSTALMGLVQVCVESATRAVHILDQLRGYNLLDTFLPYDLECGYSATLALIMVSYVCPRILSPGHNIQNAKDVIATIAAVGNSQATLRRLEIERMEELLHQRSQQAPECTSLSETSQGHDRHMEMGDMPAGQQSTLDDAILFFDAFDPSNGVPDNGIMDLADALTIGDFDFLDQ